MSVTPEFRTKVGSTLEAIDCANGVYSLFSVLGFPEDIIFPPNSERNIDEIGFNKEDREKINRIFTVLSFGQDLPVFLLEGNFGSFAGIRSIAAKFDEKYLRYLLILTQDHSQIAFVFPKHEELEPGKRKLKLVKLILNTREPFWTDINTIANLQYPGKGKTYRDVWMKWAEAFDVGKVTDQFFKEFQNQFKELRDNLIDEHISTKDAHAFALQFLNRLMFIYFVSKKGWLNNDAKFLKWFWSRYKKELKDKTAKKDSFYKIWLKQVFFSAFNNRGNKITSLPKDVKEVIIDFPYLNGGLFQENEFDKAVVLKKASIKDQTFKSIFNFYERYNFTIKEDMPLEQEVAVDPQMIGYVYESLANVAEEIYDRKDLGIFYTPRAEVDFMCKRTLVEYFAKQFPDVPKKMFYIFVFDDDCKEAEDHFTRFKLWDDLEAKLDDLDVVDPACGSGAFLVGMLNVLTGLYKVVYKHIDRSYAKRDSTFDYRTKQRIIMNSLYGVDVMPWAVHAAELRLWLQMIIESNVDINLEPKQPLLPNLDLNLCVGDSLVQEIGGVQYNLRDLKETDELKRRLDALKHDKRNYFLNVKDKYSSLEDFVKEEARLFGLIVKEKIAELKEKKKKTESVLKDTSVEQSDLLEQNGRIHESKIKELETRLMELTANIESLQAVLKDLNKTGKREFIWEIDFAEIFGDKGGFDIVIGNPPYVDRLKISPPNKTKAEIKKTDRDLYKDKLSHSVLLRFPQLSKIDRKSDYYIYFYYHGLSLLNERGTFCFITSNSWLDVGYGAGFQEFLSKYVPIIGIYDSTKRSFEHADVNTVIVILGVPFRFKGQYTLRHWKEKGSWRALNHAAKFVLFYKPFETILNSEIQIKVGMASPLKQKCSFLELVDNLYKSDDMRIFSIVQEDLLEDGWEYTKGEMKSGHRFLDGEYIGNKWGGKFLRAPEIYYRIISKKKNQFAQLGNVARVFLGITTGNNEYFYLSRQEADQWRIEEEFLFPLLKSPDEIDDLILKGITTGNFLVSINKSKKELKSTKALKYINQLEKMSLHKRPFFSSRHKDRWFFQDRHSGDIVQPYQVWLRHFASINKAAYVIDKQLVIITIENKRLIEAFSAILNSTIFQMFKEIFGRANFGLGSLQTSITDMKRVLTIDPGQLKDSLLRQLSVRLRKIASRKIEDVFVECGICGTKPIREQIPNPMPDRKALDDVIFDALGLTPDERNEVYWSVCELVKARLDKAKTFKKKA